LRRYTKVNGASRRRDLLQLVVPPGWLPLSLGGEAGRCRLPVSKPVLKAHIVSALEAII